MTLANIQPHDGLPSGKGEPPAPGSAERRRQANKERAAADAAARRQAVLVRIGRRGRLREALVASLVRDLGAGWRLGLGAVLRELADRSEAHEIDGYWRLGPAPTIGSQLASLAPRDGGPVAASPERTEPSPAPSAPEPREEGAGPEPVGERPRRPETRGQRCRRRRQALAMSQVAVGKVASLSTCYVSWIENDRDKSPERLAAVEAALDRIEAERAARWALLAPTPAPHPVESPPPPLRTAAPAAGAPSEDRAGSPRALATSEPPPHPGESPPLPGRPAPITGAETEGLVGTAPSPLAPPEDLLENYGLTGELTIRTVNVAQSAGWRTVADVPADDRAVLQVRNATRRTLLELRRLTHPITVAEAEKEGALGGSSSTAELERKLSALDAQLQASWGELELVDGLLDALRIPEGERRERLAELRGYVRGLRE